MGVYVNHKKNPRTDRAPGRDDLYSMANMDGPKLVNGMFYQHLVEHGYPFVIGGSTLNRPSAVPLLVGIKALDQGKSRAGSSSRDDGTHLFVELPDAAVHIGHWGTTEEPKVWWYVAAATVETARAISSRLEAAFPLIKPRDENTIPVMFWSMGSNNPAAVHRALAAPDPSILDQNYPPRVRAALKELVAKQDSDSVVGGRLILLHGKPGTGKTTLLRLLAREWKSWCDVHYINDPEQFLGKAQYMTSVLINDETPGYHAVLSPRLRDGRWKLIILEDADEFLSVDAKDRTGQALQRLLNLGDGFLGQGAQALILLTTNEPVQKIHPAIVRPGRNLADIEFTPFSRDEANAWLESHGVEDRVTQSESTLAELYEHMAHSKVSNLKERKGMGFVA